MTPGSPSVAPTTPAPTVACVPEVVLLDEDFEGPGSVVESEWSFGSTTEAVGFSVFLGLLGAGREEMSRTIQVPRSSGPVAMRADRLAVAFAVYQIDNWTSQDKFYAVINGVEVDLGEMDSTSTSAAISGSEPSGISWQRQTPQQGTNLGYGSSLDKKHLVQMTIPASLFPGEVLSLGFRVVTSRDIASQSAGVDDLVVTSYYDCAPTGPTSAPVTWSPTVTPGSPSVAPTTAGPTTGAPTTGTPTVTPGSPSLAPTTGVPTTGAPTTGLPTTGTPTVTPGSPSVAPTTAGPTTGAPTTATPLGPH